MVKDFKPINTEFKSRTEHKSVASAFLVRVQGGPLNTHLGDVSRQQSKIKQIIKPEGANNKLSSETDYLGGRVNRHMCQ